MPLCFLSRVYGESGKCHSCSCFEPETFLLEREEQFWKAVKAIADKDENFCHSGTSDDDLEQWQKEKIWTVEERCSNGAGCFGKQRMERCSCGRSCLLPLRWHTEADRTLVEEYGPDGCEKNRDPRILFVPSLENKEKAVKESIGA